MRRFLKYVLVFFAIVIAIDISYGIIGDYIYHHTKPGEIKQFNDFCLKNKYEVIIMGSSRAHHHYDPRIIQDSLGMSAYNIGVDGNGIILDYAILQMITERYTPKLIIYDVMPVYDMFVLPSDDNCTRYLKELKPYFENKNVANIIKDVSPSTYYECFSGLYRYNSSMITNLSQFCKATHYYDDGFAPSHGELKKADLNSYKDDCTQIKDSIKIKYLRMFCQLCKEKNIPLVLGVSPKCAARPVGMNDILQSISTEYNIPLLDFYEDSRFVTNISYFKDHDHLNIKGAEFYTAVFVDSLSHIYSNEFKRK